MELLAVIAIPAVLIALAASYRWGKSTPSSARQREQARRNYVRDINSD